MRNPKLKLKKPLFTSESLIKTDEGGLGVVPSKENTDIKKKEKNVTSKKKPKGKKDEEKEETEKNNKERSLSISDESIINKLKQKTSNSVTINESEEDRNKHFFRYIKHKKKKEIIKVYCIYRRNPYLYIMDENSKFSELKEKFYEELKIEKDLLDFRVNEKPLTNENDNQLLKEIIVNEKTNMIHVNKVMVNSNSLVNDIYSKNYDNIIIVENVKDITDLESKIKSIMDDFHCEKDFFIQTLEENKKYSIGFNYSKLAFDVNRYLSVLKNSNPDYENIQVCLKLKKCKSPPKAQNLKFSQMLIDGVKKAKNENSGIYSGGPYFTLQDVKNKDRNDSKKKWISDKIFKP